MSPSSSSGQTVPRATYADVSDETNGMQINPCGNRTSRFDPETLLHKCTMSGSDLSLLPPPCRVVYEKEAADTGTAFVSDARHENLRDIERAKDGPVPIGVSMSDLPPCNSTKDWIVEGVGCNIKEMVDEHGNTVTLTVDMNNNIPLPFSSRVGPAVWTHIVLQKKPLDYKPNKEVRDIPPAADHSATRTQCDSVWPAGSLFRYNAPRMQPLSGKGWNEEAEDYSGPRREGHFLQKYNRTFEHLQNKRPGISGQFQRGRGLEEEFEAILRTTTT